MNIYTFNGRLLPVVYLKNSTGSGLAIMKIYAVSFIITSIIIRIFSFC